MAVNVLGTWHVLLAAEGAGASRVVYFSSGQFFGLTDGERLPDYFPVDDAHPRRAMRAYGLSKCLAEDLCAGYTARTGIPTVSLRPAWVLDPGMYQRSRHGGSTIRARNGRRPGSMASSSMSATSPTPCAWHLRCPWKGITAFYCAPPISPLPRRASWSARGHLLLEQDAAPGNHQQRDDHHGG